MEDISCEICGKKMNEPEVKLNVGKHREVPLCKECYKRFMNVRQEILTMIGRKCLYKHLQPYMFKRVVVYSVEWLEQYLNKHTALVSGITEDASVVLGYLNVRAITFYAFPRNPMQPVLEVVIPYEVILVEAKRRYLDGGS